MQQKYSCPKCSSPIDFGVKFCGNCGTTLNWAAVQQTLPKHPAYQQSQQTKKPVQPPAFNQYQQDQYYQRSSKPYISNTNKVLMGFAILIIVSIAIFGICLNSAASQANDSPVTQSDISQDSVKTIVNM